MGDIKVPAKTIEETISVCLENNITFAAYRLPNEKKQFIVAQKDYEPETTSDFSGIGVGKGFFVAPFLRSNNCPMFIIKPDFYFEGGADAEGFEEMSKIKHRGKGVGGLTSSDETSREEYLGQIEKIIDAIKKQEVQKVVLSRAKVVCLGFLPRAHKIFSSLCGLFPNAFIYVFNAAGNLWMGATPEPFALLGDNVFKTSSVAGTKENSEKYLNLENWEGKEKQEQKYVSDYIGSVLKASQIESIEHRGPYVKKAGALLHLRTDFISNIKFANGNIGRLINDLHPTPAVCGFPKNKALEIIRSLEKHDREYYSGFLGPVGMGSTFDLFVNLRCMKIMGQKMVLYSGGGLTIGSKPADEWHETEIKAGTLLSVIEKF